MMDVGSLIDNVVICITGGSGTLGQALVSELLANYRPRKLIVFSRSESRQAAMKERWPETATSPLRYFVGDVRDRQRVLDVLDGVDLVIHAAALKRIEVCEREPKEAVLTNIFGTLNVAEAARQSGVSRFLFVSSDKATEAATLYGGTKYVAERLTIAMNQYSGTRYSAVRYGNVLGSTGSVLHTFRGSNGVIPITHPEMTRFFITPSDAARFCLSSLCLMRGGETFVPKLPSMRIVDMAWDLNPGATMQVVGLRGAEKLAELMISQHESAWCYELPDRYAILPPGEWRYSLWPGAKRVPEGFSYTSANNTDWLTAEQLKEMLDAG